MKHLFLLSLGLVLISLFVGCKKGNGTTRISGRVLEKGSNKGIANAKVIFSECVPGDDTFSPAVCLDVETVLTNAQGEYTFVKENDSASDYRIRAEKNNYGSVYPVYHLANAGESSKNLNFTLPAYAWIKFHVKNVNPFDENDLIRAPGSYGGDTQYYLYGKKIDTTYVLGNKYVGNQYFTGNMLGKFSWMIEKQSLKKQYKDSIFLKGLDTAFYEIKY